MKRFSLEQVRELNYRISGGEYVAEVEDGMTARIIPNRTASGEKIRNSYSARVNGKKVGTGSLKDCKIFIGLHLLDLEVNTMMAQ